MSSPTIFKTKEPFLSLVDVRYSALSKLKEGEKFLLRYKVGKKWKLKGFRVLQPLTVQSCGCCGSNYSFSFGNQKNKIELEGHFGPSSYPLYLLQ